MRLSSVLGLSLVLVYANGSLAQISNAGRAGSSPPVGSSSAPANGQQSQIKFKSQAILVQIPAVVTDRDGRHVRNLTQNDFSVFEDKKEEKISIFEEVTASTARPPAFRNLPNTFTNLALYPAQRCALTVVVLDAINADFLDQAFGRKELIEYLTENLNAKEATALMLMSSNGVKKLSDITDDFSSLIVTLKALNGEIPSTQGFDVSPQLFSRAPKGPSLSRQEKIAEATLIQEQAIDETMQAFLAIAWSLSGIPAENLSSGRREVSRSISIQHLLSRRTPVCLCSTNARWKRSTTLKYRYTRSTFGAW